MGIIGGDEGEHECKNGEQWNGALGPLWGENLGLERLRQRQGRAADKKKRCV